MHFSAEHLEMQSYGELVGVLWGCQFFLTYILNENNELK